MAHVVEQVVLERLEPLIPLRAQPRLVHEIGAVEPERQRLEAMPGDNLQSRIAVEDPARDESQQVIAGFDPEPEHRPIEPGVDHPAHHRIGQRRRVNIQRLAGIGERAEDRVEPRFVEVMALRVAVDLDALEAQFARAAADFGGAPLGVLRRDRGHANEAIGMRVACRREQIVGIAPDAPGLFDIEQRLYAGRGQREDRLVDPGLVHVAQPQVAQIDQPLHDLHRAFRRRLAIEAPQADQPLVGGPVANHPQENVDLLARREGFLGGDPQVTAVAAGFQFVGHLITPRVPPWSPCTRARPRGRPRCRGPTI